MKKIFTLFAISMIAVCAMAGNHVLKLTQTNSCANAWDTQLFINVKNLQPNKNYVVYLDVKASEPVTLGTEEMDNQQTDHKDPYNNSAVFNYTDELNVTTDWTTGTVHFKGVTDVNCSAEGHGKHEAFEFAASALLINVGKVNGELYIDNIVVKDEEGNVVFSNDFESSATLAPNNKSADAYYPGWQVNDGKTWEIEELMDHVVEDYMLKIDVSKVMPNSWDSQVLINIPTMNVSSHYAVYMSVKASVETPKIGAFIEDTKSSNKDPYGNSADLKYSNDIALTTEWAQTESIFSYQDDEQQWIGTTDGKFPYDRLVLQLGAFAGTMYVDNIKIVEVETGNIQIVDFKDGIAGIADKRSYHDQVSVAKVESDCPEFETPTGIHDVVLKADNANVMYNIAGQRVQNAKGIVIMNGKKVVF